MQKLGGFVLGTAFLCASAVATAHEIPSDATVHLLFKAEGQRLRLLVRAPMKSIRDVEFPLQGSGYLDLERSAPYLADAATLWLSDAIEIREDGAKFGKPRVAAARISLESDRSFTSFETALANIVGPPLPKETAVVRNQTMLDVLFEYAIRSDRSRFSLHPAFDKLGLRTVTVLRVFPPTGGERVFEFQNDPGLVPLDPSWFQTASRFSVLGFEHILDGTDHLLFLLCLVAPFRRVRTLIPIVTGFTLAHSVTLIAAAYKLGPDGLWFPPLVETLIAASIVYMALENILGRGSVHQRWLLTLAFGLVHGFGFSFALQETLQLAGAHLLTSLLAFNIGVEAGQIAVLLVLVPLLQMLLRRAVPEREGVIVISAIAAHTGWHWMIERYSTFRKFRVTWPELHVGLLVNGLRWLMLLVAMAGLFWLLFGVFWRRREAENPATAAEAE